MAKRVVDSFEVVEVEIENGKPRATMDPTQLLVQPLAEHHAIGQVGQCIIMRQMRNALLGALAFGDVLVGGDPSAAGERLVHNTDGSAISCLNDELGCF